MKLIADEEEKTLDSVLTMLKNEKYGCFECEHVERETFTTCEAFPDQIPRPIFMCEVLHTKPYTGNHGIQFKRRKKEKV